MHIVIINKNQQQYVKPMMEALHPLVPTFVFDRCEPVKYCNYILNNEGEGFLAGRMRDLGANGIDDDILFLDGDKVPNGDIIADINSLKDKYDCICYGIDCDKENSEYREFMKTDNTDGIVEWQKDNKPYAYGCYSCGIWLSKDAVSKVRSLNGGRIFHPEFDGKWGDEDNFLADELNALGFRIGFSTHVHLAGEFSDCRNKMDDFTINFILRIKLRKTLLGKNI